MVGHEQRGREASGSHRRKVAVVVLAVALTVAYTWKKVELARVAEKITGLEGRAAALVEEQSKLTAAIASKKKPGTIKQIAEDKLGMAYPEGGVAELVVLGSAGGELQ